MIISKFNDLTHFISYLNKKIEDHFSTEFDLNTDLLSHMQNCNLSSSDFSHYYSGSKTDLKNNVFSDLLPSLRDSLLESFISNTQNINSYYFIPNTISFYDIFHQLENDDIDYSNYFSNIKSVITKLTNDNKFYRKNITDLNVEIVELRKQNADLQHQLQIKSISTWG